ncbi:CBO0543 family protein [Bacillus kwashiorkori]|uniref:CBO0543 family protein n=1 Tax=Bacillus kwashiorkori TaxID=1522318 RepID=UPI00078543AC|nr:CBO0543 family protein [Bacillus kwashiorkori]
MKRREKLKYKHLYLILGIIFFSRKSWSDIPKYYKNMLYVGTFNSLYYLLCRRHLVWEFTPFGFKWAIVRIIHIVIVTPLIILTYLSNAPNSLFKQIIYTIKWVVGASFVEFVAHKQKLIMYAHRWNVFWSSLLFTLMFIFSKLFSKNAILTIILSCLSTCFFIIKFDVPINRKKHYSKFIEPLVDLYYHSSLKNFFGHLKSR